MSASREFKKVREMFTNIDAFSEPIRFTFDKGKTEFTTFMGAVATLVYLSLLLGYAMLKLVNMTAFVDSNVQKQNHPDYYNSGWKYNANDTFAIGIAKFGDM
jgi:hypothetical protein